MNEYIKNLLVGGLTGGIITQVFNLCFQTWSGRNFEMGGEFLVPALIVGVGYTGYKIAYEYFKEFDYKKIYQKGYNEAMRKSKYKIIIPIEEELNGDGFEIDIPILEVER